MEAGHGTFDADSARRLMSRPVAMKSNLHSVLFETASSRFWVANASRSGEPASSQPYQEYRLTDLLAHRPDASITPLPAPPSAPPEEKEAEAP